MSRLKVVPVILLHVVVALVALELCARLDDRFRDGAPLTGAHSIDALFRDDETGRHGIPGARFGKWSMNSLGFRGPEPLRGREVVLVFGASESFGLYETQGAEYPAVLHEELERRRPGRFTVVNAAVPGMRIGNVEALARAIARTNPRYVVLYASPATYIGVEAPYCGAGGRPPSPPAGRAEPLRLAGKIRTLVKAHVPEKILTPLRRWSIDRALDGRAPAEAVSAKTVEAFQTDVDCARSVVIRAGAIPVLVTHATYFGDELDARELPQMTLWRQFYPQLAETGFIDLERRANEAIRDVARASGAVLVDAARRIPAGPEHFADFVHFTDRGARVMSEVLAESIARSEPAR